MSVKGLLALDSIAGVVVPRSAFTAVGVAGAVNCAVGVARALGFGGAAACNGCGAATAASTRALVPFGFLMAGQLLDDGDPVEAATKAAAKHL